MSSLISEIHDGKTRWRLIFRLDDKQRQLRLGHINDSQAKSIQSKIDDLIRSIKLNIDPKIGTQQWIQSADWKLIERLEALGLTAKIDDLIRQRRQAERPDELTDSEKRPTLLEFCQWYIRQRKADCEKSTIRKITASLNQLCDYCRDHESIHSVDDLDSEMAFRFQLHRQHTKAEATVSKDVKIAKTAFSFGVKAGQVSSNPFENLKPGSDVNLDGQHIVPISDYEKLIDACTDSDWRTIIALARLGGLRCPSELTNLKWTDVNWHARTILITATKTKRYGKTERTLPLFDRLEKALSDHWELTGEFSEYVITAEHLRRAGVSLSERFQRIRKAAGVPKFDNPFRNMRLSAVNDVCRIRESLPRPS